MDWYKHKSGARKDPKIQRAVREFGEAGYSRVFRMYETVAEYGGSGADFVPMLDLNHPATDSVWFAGELGISVDQLQSTADLFASLGLIDPEHWQRKIIFVPRMLALRDEWARKRAAEKLRSDSGANPEGVRSESGPATESRRSNSPQNKELRSKKQSKKQSKKEETEKTSCAQAPSAIARAAIFLPLNDGAEYPISEKAVAEWKGLYPGIDVMQALRSMRAWLLAHKANRKTKTGIEKFVVAWLNRDQDKAPRKENNSGSSIGNSKPRNAINSGRPIEKRPDYVFEV